MLASARAAAQKNCVRRTLRLTCVATALAGWMVATGLAWDGLQLAAWAGMAWRNAATMDAAEAVREAIAGAPCRHCLSIREGRKQGEQRSPAEVGKRQLADFDLPQPTSPILHLPRQSCERPVDESGEPRFTEVALPPPKARFS